MDVFWWRRRYPVLVLVAAAAVLGIRTLLVRACRIITEALANVAKHAPAAATRVRLKHAPPEELLLASITLNTVNPGPADTGYAPPEAHEAVRRRFPQGKWGDPDDPARLIAWLVTDEAAWITGQVINTEGGFRRGKVGQGSRGRPAVTGGAPRARRSRPEAPAGRRAAAAGGRTAPPTGGAMLRR